MHLRRQRARAARRRLEDLALVRTLGTHEAGHVLDDAQDPDAGLAAEVDLLAHVEQGDLLRRGHDDGAVDAALLQEAVHAEVLVAGPRRGVDEQEVHGPPLDVLEELLDEAVLLRAAPDDGVVAVRQHELHGHDGEVVEDPDGRPAGRADVDRRRLDAEHLRDRGPADVRVHDAHGGVGVARERVREQRGEGRLADAALAREHEHLVADVGEARRDEGDVGVGALGRGRADGLVRTAGAGVGGACALGFGAGTVLGFGGDELGGLLEGVREDVEDV